jgi:hypothetical protein
MTDRYSTRTGIDAREHGRYTKAFYPKIISLLSKKQGKLEGGGKYQRSLPVPTPAVKPLVAVISGDGVHGESGCLGKEERCREERHDGEAHFDVLF